jgi:ribosomal protein S18 acetylase RimI-like enzyme
MSQLPKILRPPKKTDLNFIYSSWLKSFIDSPDNPISEKAYYSYQHLLISSILDRALVSILCNPDDLDQIFGFAVYELTHDKLTIHWLHIKYSFRQLGFAKFILDSLLKAAENEGIFNTTITITHRGLSYRHLKDKFSHIYNPKEAFRLKEIE